VSQQWRALSQGRGWRSARGQQAAAAAVFRAQRQWQMEVFENFAMCWERAHGA
jgi:hypothetical protein